MKAFHKPVARINLAHSRVGAVVGTLASHQCGSGSILARCHMWAEFVVGSHVASGVFLQVLGFSSIHKNQHLQIPVRPG